MAKNNERLWRVVKFAVYVAVILIGVAIAFGSLRNQVHINSKEIDQNDARITRLEESVTEQRVDIKYIKETTNKILEKIE